MFEENVKKDIEYGLKNMKLSQTDISERIEEVINIVGLEKKYYKNLLLSYLEVKKEE